MKSPVALPAELTIYTVGELRALCLAQLGEPADEPIVLDASAAAEVDAAGLQVLLSLANTLGAQQRRLVLAQPGPALRDACARLGLQALLDTEAAA